MKLITLRTYFLKKSGERMFSKMYKLGLATLVLRNKIMHVCFGFSISGAAEKYKPGH